MVEEVHEDKEELAQPEEGVPQEVSLPEQEVEEASRKLDEAIANQPPETPWPEE